jgi:hypothetical protein
MTTVGRLKIDRIVIEMANAARAREVEGALRAALAILARRIVAAPISAGADVHTIALERLRSEMLSPVDLVSGAAAERLADDLFRQLVSSAGGHSATGGGEGRKQ